MDATPTAAGRAERSAIRSRGLDLEVLTWGGVTTAETVVLALHGYLDSAAFFAPLASALREVTPGVAVVAMSAAGHGGSDRADAYAWADHIADALALMDDVLERAAGRVVVMGHSFGGLQAIEAVARRSEATALVNLDAVASPTPSTDEQVRRAWRRMRERHPARRELRAYRSLDEMVERRRVANPRIDRDVLRPLVADLAVRVPDGTYRWRVDPLLAGWVRAWELVGNADFSPLERMAEIDRPLLVVTGAGDDAPLVRGPYPGDAAIRGVPGARHVRLPDAGHYVHVERPEAVAAAVGQFLQTLDEVAA